MKHTFKKWLSLTLAVIMLLTTLPMSIFATGSVTQYADFMADLKVLEKYADEYAALSYRNPGELVLNFIRTGVDRYRDDSWSTIAGPEITGFTNYVETQDEEKGTTVMDLRNIVTTDFKIPNGDQVDFGHMFGTMNISYVAPGSADLSGWAGDLCDLLYYCVYDTKVPDGTIDEMAAYIRDNCFGADASDAFGWDDFYGDMDGYYLVSEFKKGNKSLSALMEEYFTANLSDVDRAVYFVNNRFAVEDSNAAVRKAIYDSYSSNLSIKLLEDGRGLSSYNKLREACCYALADYLYSLAKGHLIAGTEDDSETDNDYYTVFSTESSTLAPGITQDIKYAKTVDGKQIVYYVATVDVKDPTVTIMANYKDNDPSKGWGYQRVEDQAAALLQNYQNKYENFNVIVATNADAYNMSTGEPGGLLVMDGKEWHAVDSDGFFAIIDTGKKDEDGNPIEEAIIGTKADYEIYKNQIKEAVGGFGAVLVKDGKMNVTKNDNYIASRASRTAIGIKEDGSVVMMVLDGRQLPFSAGGAMEEIAQIMLDAGCVHAINLDGGGSSTYLSKPAGSDKLQLTNRPSDGFARSVSTSLVAVSTAPSSNEFHHAIITTEYEYITKGTSMKIGVTGVSNTGNSAPLPEGSYWKVSDESIASITADGVFTAKANGKVTVDFMIGNVSAGSVLINVVVPDSLSMEAASMTAIYGQPATLPIIATYRGNRVAVKSSDFYVQLQYHEAATIDGLSFTPVESSGYRTFVAGAVLLANTNLIAYLQVNVYRADETIFDFDNATYGNRTLAWNREVSNTRTTDNFLYRIIDPTAPIEIDYTFALDMTSIDIPAQLEPLKSMLPGADTGTSTAWGFLLNLAERVCNLTTITITCDFSPNLDVNIDDIEIITDYFELESAVVDENNRLTVTIKWKEQDAAIDAATANPLCILNGVKATVKKDANFNNNELLINNNGKVSYDIYLAATQLYSFVTNPENNAQEVFGLYPYEHDPTCRTDGNDKGGHFSSEYTDFLDNYGINSEIRKGWIEDSYYVDNQEVTGVQFIPSRENTNKKFFYEFDEKGVLVKALSGLIEYEGDIYYAMNGEPQKKWASVTVDGKEVYYYFDPATFKAVDGVQEIDEGIIFTYTFENHILVKGDLHDFSYTDKDNKVHSGIGYRWAGTWLSGQWFEVDGNSYYIQKYQYVVDTGFLYKSPSNQDVPYDGYYFFGDDGVFQKDFTGIYNDYYIENGMACTYSYRLVEVDGYYYFVDGETLKIYKNRDENVNAAEARGLVPTGTYHFGADGRMTNELVKIKAGSVSVDSCQVYGRGVTVKNDKVCRAGYLVNGEYVTAEVIENADGSYTFVIPSNVAVNTEILLVVAGDVSGDGVIDLADQTKLAAALLPSDDPRAVQLTPEQLLAADINGNGVFNSADRTLIARSLLDEEHRMHLDLDW